MNPWILALFVLAFLAICAGLWLTVRQRVLIVDEQGKPLPRIKLPLSKRMITRGQPLALAIAGLGTLFTININISPTLEFGKDVDVKGKISLEGAQRDMDVSIAVFRPDESWQGVVPKDESIDFNFKVQETQTGSYTAWAYTAIRTSLTESPIYALTPVSFSETANSIDVKLRIPGK